MAMKLLVDVGNRRLKWACARGETFGGVGDGGGDGEFISRGVINFAGESDAAALAAQWAKIPPPSSVWVACVSTSAAKAALTAQVQSRWNLEPNFIRAQKYFSDFVNAYSNPNALGVDRFAALIAAHALHPNKTLIVIDAGTAVTVDLMDCGIFRGGVIFPGMRAMRKSLARHAANINSDRDNINTAAAENSKHTMKNLNPIATDTAAAVNAGATFALIGGVELILARMRKNINARECFIIAGGGDAEMLAQFLSGEIMIEPDLVLRGLALISADAT